MASPLVENWYELDDEDEPEPTPLEKETEAIKLEFSLETGHDLTLLMFASKTGKEQTVSALIKSGVNVNEKNQKGLTALSHAVLSGHLNCVQTLVANCADVNCTDENGDTLIMVAAKRELVDIVRCLLTAGARKSKKSHMTLSLAAFNGTLQCLQTFVKAGINVNIPDTQGLTVLMKAAAEGLSKVVECLVQAEARVNPQCKEGKTALNYAASNGHLECVQILHESKADLNLADSDGQTPLMKAAVNGHDCVVDYLVQFLDETELNVRCPKGKTAFFYAAELGHFECLKGFIGRCKINFDMTDHEGYSPLTKAICQNHSAVAEYLLLCSRCDTVSKDDATAANNLDRQTPLMKAVVNGHARVVYYLLGALEEAELNVVCPQGKTAFFYAAQFGCFQFVKAFMARCKINLDETDSEGHTPLTKAICRNHSEIVEYLLEHGARCDTVCQDGMSAIHCAASTGNLDNLQGVILHDDRKVMEVVNLKNTAGQTPLMIAALNRHDAIVNYLLMVPIHLQVAGRFIPDGQRSAGQIATHTDRPPAGLSLQFCKTEGDLRVCGEKPKF